ncbi:ABC transporter permease [Longispora sp. K20-0274]|uniref:ABC transporter permease n=1 Tax=Longispora sp. K20-0274 TaxID=3088255 RepID=UPI00399A3130
MSTLAVIRSEWSKVWSLRSTPWSLAATAVLTIAIGMLAVFATEMHEGTPGSKTSASLTGFLIGQLAICVLGTLIATGEYTTGQIRVTLAAVPNRSRFLLAKATVAAAVAFSGGLAIGLAAFLAGQSVLGGQAASLTDPSVLRAILGVGLYSGVLGVFSLAVGFLIRHSAGAIATVIAVLYIGPIVLMLLGEFGEKLSEWWPTGAGARIMNPDAVDAWQGLAIFVGWTVVLLGGAWGVLRQRDA